MNEDLKHQYTVTIFCAGDSEDEVHEYILSLLSDSDKCSILDVYTDIYED